MPVALWLAARTWAYTQAELLAAAVLGRAVRGQDARVVQLGGGGRELYYYPKSTVQARLAVRSSCAIAVLIFAVLIIGPHLES